MLLILFLQIRIVAKKNLMYIFNDYFTSIFFQEDLSSLLSVSVFLFLIYVPPISISVEGVASLLSSLNHHKATGPDNIPAYGFLLEE